MNAIISKISKLVSLASSPVEAEARTAAYMACKLMREHGLSVGGGDSARVSELEGRVRSLEVDVAFERDMKEKSGRFVVALSRDLEAEKRRAEMAEAKVRELETKLAQKASSAVDEAVKATSRPSGKRRFGASRAKEMSAKYDGKCGCCGGPIYIGETIMYDGKAHHPTCYARENAA